mmetsp:Transcript_16422/g.25368  ORF Transcript_16422/g.25368 Transcript_16422/m.25368 type:complete len:119 (+) Transcript_16422:1004-1360(+)
MEANRQTHPSQEDAASDASMEDDVSEVEKKPVERIIEGALQNKDKPKEPKSRDGRSKRDSQRDRSRDSTQGSEQLMESDKRFQRLREKKRALREVEQQEPGQMSLSSGIRKKRRTQRE